MEGTKLVENLAAKVGVVPPQVEILSLRQIPLDEIERRAKSFLAALGDVCKQPMDRGDWVHQQDRTVVRMPLGARAVLYPASGAMNVHTGLKPMEALYRDDANHDALVKSVEQVAERSRVRDWVATSTSLRFERLWYVRAAAASRDSKLTRSVLCRAVGSYRHVIKDLPVWGPASVVVKVAADGKLDSLALQMREPTGEMIERVTVLRPEQAARQIALQLRGLVGKSKINLDEATKPEWMHFGYWNLSKHKAQRLLAPVYAAAIHVGEKQDSQGYLFVIPATEIAYLPLPVGIEAKPTPLRGATGEVRVQAATH
jgi:hypothetical protein